ncbi:MAG: hypothetical protein PVH19_15900 [Planctomycetia bacterium]
MPSNVEMYDEAIQLEAQGDRAAAIEKLRALIEQDADYSLGHAALAVFLRKEDQFDEAVEHAETVCRLEPDNAFAYVALSLVCQKAGRQEEAERAMAEARNVTIRAQMQQQQEQE